MKVEIVSATLLILALTSCQKATDTDFSGITDPQARWQAYGLRNYSIEQKLVYFCGNRGVSMKVVISDNQIVDVVDISKGTSLPQNQWQLYKTVDQLFVTISGINKDSVASFRAEYDPKYSYPISFFVDPSAQMADE